MAPLQKPEKFEGRRQKLRAEKGSARFRGCATEIISLNDLQKGDLLVKENLSGWEDDEVIGF
jgi:hypothetical protein